jgi:hypothetical protein
MPRSTPPPPTGCCRSSTHERHDRDDGWGSGEILTEVTRRLGWLEVMRARAGLEHRVARGYCRSTPCLVTSPLRCPIFRIVGIGLLVLVAGSLASFFVRQDETEPDPQLGDVQERSVTPVHNRRKSACVRELVSTLTKQGELWRSWSDSYWLFEGEEGSHRSRWRTCPTKPGPYRACQAAPSYLLIPSRLVSQREDPRVVSDLRSYCFLRGRKKGTTSLRPRATIWVRRRAGSSRKSCARRSRPRPSRRNDSREAWS